MKTAIVICVFAAVVIVFFSDVLFGPRVFLDTNPYHYDPWQSYGTDEEIANKTYRTDALVTYLPRQIELTRSIRAGRFPLWNPSIFAGTPFFADPQSRVLYPISLLLVLVDPMRAMGYDVAIHMLIALIGMYLYLRAVGCTTVGSMLGAFGYAFSSFFFLRMGHPTFIATASWIPLMFYGFERSLRSERLGVLLLTAFFTMGYLAGFPQVFAFGIGTLIAHALYLGLSGQRDTRLPRMLKTVRILGVSGLLSVLLVSVQLVPFLEFTRNATGLGITYDQMRDVFLAPPILLLRCLFPTLFGHPVEGTDWSGLTRDVPHTYNPEFAIYCGAGVLLAALGGLVFLRQSYRMRFFLVVLLFSVAIATSSLVLRVGYLLLPVFRVSRVSRVSVIGCFSLSAMAGIGLTLVSSSADRLIKMRFIRVGAVVVVLALAVTMALMVAGDAFLKNPLERARSLPEETWLRTHAQTRSMTVKEWADGSGSDWVRYERRQALKGLAVLAVAFVLLGLYVLSKQPAGRFRTVAGVLLLLLAIVDVGLLARSYLISQPSDCLFEAKGIRLLKEGLGSEGRWRIRNLSYRHEDIRGLPPNTNQIFGIPSLSGQGTMFPRSYTHLFQTFEDARIPRRLDSRDTHISPRGILLSDLSSVRYILSSSSRTPYLASPVLSMVAGGERGPCELRLLELEGQVRPAICQDANEPIAIDLEVPGVSALDFTVGFTSDADVPGPIIVFLLTYEGETGKVEFKKGLDLFSDKDGWHQFRIDISKVSGGPARIWMGVLLPESSDRYSVTAAWSGLDLVYDDCPFKKVKGGYVIDVGERGSFLRLKVKSHAREIPLDVLFSPLHRRTHWIGFPSAMQTRYVTLDVAERAAGEILLLSDSTFTLEECMAVGVGGAYPGLELVHDSDLYIYENFSAVAKGICVDKRFGAFRERGGRSVLDISYLEEIADIACGHSRILSYEPERVAVEVNAASDCYLLFQDTFYPGWKARVDGADAEIIETSMGLRAVELGVGDHEVVMTFEPASFRFGLLLSGVGAVLTLLYALLPSGIRRPK